MRVAGQGAEKLVVRGLESAALRRRRLVPVDRMLPRITREPDYLTGSGADAVPAWHATELVDLAERLEQRRSFGLLPAQARNDRRALPWALVICAFLDGRGEDRMRADL